MSSFDLSFLLTRQGELSSSDLHLVSTEFPFFRLPSGKIEAYSENQTHIEHNDLLALGRSLVKNDAATLADLRDYDLATDINDIGRFRINIFQDTRGLGMVFRSIPKKIPTVEDLNIPQPLIDSLLRPSGLVLICGQNEAGKTTVLTSLVDYVNKNREKHIVTFEEPVEYVHKNIKSLINQREIGKHTDSYTSAMTHVLRQDADMVVLGEIRGPDTIKDSLLLAQSGYLVLGTIHTGSVLEAIERILDVFEGEDSEEGRIQLSTTLLCVMYQVLIPSKDGGRVAAQEMLVPNLGIRNIIRQGNVHQLYSSMQISKSDGNVVLDEFLLELYKRGLIDKAEAILESHFPDIVKKEIETLES